MSKNKRSTGTPVESTSTAEAPSISNAQALTDACYLYLLSGKLADLNGSPLTTEPLKLSPTHSFNIEARLGAGAEGVVYYGTLVGEGWGGGAGKDAALKVSHPFSVRHQRSIPGKEVTDDDDCRRLLSDFRSQLPALHLLQNSLTNNRQLAPKLYGSFAVPLGGKRGVAVEVVALEFIEGQRLGGVIKEFKNGDIDERTTLSHIHQTALTFRQLLLNGVAYMDATSENFIVPSKYHSGAPFSVMVDFGGAILDSTLETEEDIGESRGHAIQVFSGECLELANTPYRCTMIDSAVSIFERLKKMEITVTMACNSLEHLLLKD